jgi:tRNA 2-thiouridine synthesizing protein A
MTARTIVSSHGTPIPSPQVTLDLNGQISPGPLPALKRTLANLKNGEVLLLISDYPGIEGDLFLWAKQTKNQVLFVDRSAKKGFGFYILKGDPWPVGKLLDVTGSRCPTPVIETGRELMRMQKGESVMLISDCEVSPMEVNTWLKSTGHKLLGMTEDARGVFRFYIQK